MKITNITSEQFIQKCIDVGIDVGSKIKNPMDDGVFKNVKVQKLQFNSKPVKFKII